MRLIMIKRELCVLNFNISAVYYVHCNMVFPVCQLTFFLKEVVGASQLFNEM